MPRAKRIVRDYYPGQVERGEFVPQYDRTVGYVDVNVMDIQLQMHVQVSDHFTGNGTYRVLLFAGIIVVLRYLEMRYCFFFVF